MSLTKEQYLEAWHALEAHEKNIKNQSKETYVEHLKTNHEVLGKYNHVEPETDDTFCWIPEDWLNNYDEYDVSPKAYGLLVLLSAMSNKVPLEGNRTGTYCSVLDVRHILQLRSANSNKNIIPLFDELEQVGWISREYPAWDKKHSSPFVVLNRGSVGANTADQDDHVRQFRKLYTTTIRAIIEQYHGSSALTKLATYLAWRTTQYEKDTSPRYSDCDTSWASDSVNLTKKTYKNNLNDMLRDGILAYYVYTKAHGKYHERVRWISEWINLRYLELNITYSAERGDILRFIE